MGEIRSALEIALEKADKLGKISKEDLEKQKWTDEGKKIAAAFIQGKVDNLQDALSELKGSDVAAVLDGVMDVLLRNVMLPRDALQWDTINRALKGLVEIKGSSAAQVVPQIEQLLKTYEQTRDQYRQQFKEQVNQRMGGAQGMYGMDPQELQAMAALEQEWTKISSQINEQFEQQLRPMKEYLRG